MDEVKIKRAIAKEVRKMVEMTKNPEGRPATAAVKELLDGDGTPAKHGQEVVSTREAHCWQHGNYTDQLIKLRSFVDYKPVLLPYWLGCPQCREAMEAGRKAEEKRMGWLNSYYKVWP